MEYWEFQDQVETKADFDKFMSLLRQDWDSKHALVRRADGADTKIKETPWENCYLPDFLESIQAWVNDTSTLPDNFPYRKLADVLSAAGVYE